MLNQADSYGQICILNSNSDLKTDISKTDSATGVITDETYCFSKRWALQKLHHFDILELGVLSIMLARIMFELHQIMRLLVLPSMTLPENN